MSDDQWITFQAAAAIVRARLGASAGRSEAVTKAAHSSGEVRSEYDGVVLTNDDGAMGWNLKPGATNHGGKPLVHVLTGSGKRLYSRDDLLDWLDRNHWAPSGKPKKHTGSGAPEQFDWDDIGQFVRKEFDQRGDFRLPENKTKGWRSQNDLIKLIEDYLQRRNEPIPGPTRLKEKVAKILDQLRSELAADH